ncbi:hypothetical protein NBM05_09695, partial [Rothia sp. AR01]|nr:hypothetical protein [Rothia santali]
MGPHEALPPGPAGSPPSPNPDGAPPGDRHDALPSELRAARPLPAPGPGPADAPAAGRRPAGDDADARTRLFDQTSGPEEPRQKRRKSELFDL